MGTVSQVNWHAKNLNLSDKKIEKKYKNKRGEANLYKRKITHNVKYTIH